MPRFMLIRWSAYAECRSSGGVSRASSVGLAGPEAARCPTPSSAEQRKRVPRLPDQREERERATACSINPSTSVLRPADAVDESSPPRQPVASAATPPNASASPASRERDPTHVVQVDDDEREHDPVSERVDDAAYLDEPDLARQVRIEPARRYASRCISGF